MKFDWNEYYILAKWLVDIESNRSSNTVINSDAVLRCVISRSYYSAHCQASKYLRKYEGLIWLPKYEMGTHQWVLSCFLKDSPRVSYSLRSKKILNFEELTASIYADLYALKVERIFADYKEYYPDLELQGLKLAQDCVRRSSDVLDNLEKLYCS